GWALVVDSGGGTARAAEALAAALAAGFVLLAAVSVAVRGPEYALVRVALRRAGAGTVLDFARLRRAG
ncbi:MAG: hypothetical protein LC713_01605, partial [Actinobacteria bacterium]|nr:hypothetical protein [Actinomycetota bacterium]